MSPNCKRVFTSYLYGCWRFRPTMSGDSSFVRSNGMATVWSCKSLMVRVHFAMIGRVCSPSQPRLLLYFYADRMDETICPTLQKGPWCDKCLQLTPGCFCLERDQNRFFHLYPLLENWWLERCRQLGCILCFLFVLGLTRGGPSLLCLLIPLLNPFIVARLLFEFLRYQLWNLPDDFRCWKLPARVLWVM